MKILMKGSIQRDWNADTFSSSQVATISLQDAQAMNPPPRPPSPNSRSTIQRASRIAGDTNSLSARDAQLLMQNAKPVPTSPQPHGPKPSMSVSIPASSASPASAGSGSGSRSSRFSFFKNATLSRSASTLFGAGAQTSAISSGASSSATSPQEVLSSQLLSVQENRLSEDKAVGLEEATKNAPRITTPKSSHVS